MKNPLVTRYGDERRWVNYKLEEVKGKMTKVPYSPIMGGKASSTDAETWGTVDNAFRVSPQIGIVFTPDMKLLGVDIDHCLEGNKIVHEEKEKIERFIKEANSYTEISPSGEGLHVFLEIEDGAGLALEANRHGNFECYTKGRYFTVTSKPFGAQKDIRRIESGSAKLLLEILGYPWGKQTGKELSDSTQGNSIDDERGSNIFGKANNQTDTDVLEKIFNAKNGEEVKKLWNGDASAYNNDLSVADMGLLAHLAFWTRKDAGQMERLWMQSPLGAREKTQTRKDYRDRSIANAISQCREVYEGKSDMEREMESMSASEIKIEDLDLLFMINDKKEKVYIQNTENMCRILRKYPEFVGTLRTDVFKNTLEIKKNGKWQDMETAAAIFYQTRIQVIFPFFRKVPKEMVYDAMIHVAKENQIDSAADYLKSLKWDGVARLDTWLCKTYGVEENDYHKAVGSNWLKGMVKRLIMPGCKFDYVLVLEGDQGIKKSTSLGVLGRDWHVETTMSTDTKDFFMQFQGKAIIEFSEGETLSRTEVKRMKAIITTQSDKYRLPYERISQDFPRRCVFAMTTNQQEYLKDETGNRRWLPVACQGIANVAWLEENRDQLFAEAYDRVINKNESTWEFPEEATRAAQMARQVQDANTDLVADWYFNKLTPKNREEGITIHQVYQDCLSRGFASKPLDKWTEMAIANILKNGLRLEKNRRMVEGVQLTRWFEAGTSIRTFEKVLPETSFGVFDEDAKEETKF